jgi:peroxiredoxin
MLGPGDAIPDATVWTGALDAPVRLEEAIAGGGDALLCFYPFDWSPTCTSELRLLHDRHDALEAAGIRAFGVSLDGPWSQRAFGEALGLGETVTLLSDRLGEASRAFGVLSEWNGLPRAERSAFLVRGDTVVASWSLGSELPDVDAILASASSS